MQLIRNHKVIFIILLACVLFGIFSFVRDQKDTSNHIANSLYESDERIYHDYLGADDQAMYDLLFDMTIKHKITKIIDMDDFHCYDYLDCADVLSYAHDAIIIDHPELMNYAGYQWRYVNNQFILTLRPSYMVSYKDYYGVWKTESILCKIEKDTKKMTDKEKIMYVYDWMGSHNQYDYYFTYTSKNQSIYNVFVKRNAVCAGFAKASQIIFSRIGIESYIVNGSSDDFHMWNVVKYDDHYYYFDSTIAVGYKKSSEHYYEGLKQEYMNSYSPFHSDWYPTIEETNMFEI